MKHLVDLAQLSADLTSGDEAAFRRRISKLLDDGFSLSLLVELILQTSLFAGVPRCLNGFRSLHEVTGESLEALEESYRFEMVEPFEQGESTFEKVYGDKTQLLREALNRWHPALENWVIKNAYGEILSRPFMSLKEREVAAVASLIVQNLPLQLWGHMKGALKNGVSTGEMKAIIESLQGLTTHTPMAFEMYEKLK